MEPLDGIWPLACVPVVAALGILSGAVSRKGALAGLLVGAAVAWGGGWRGFFMLAALLVVGTLCSRGSSRGRGTTQVVCNGAVAAVAALLSMPIAMAGALSAALSDTVAGELGQRFGGEPRRLLFFARAERGADGAMTPAGTLLAIPAACVVAAIGHFDDWRVAAAVALAGFLGNLVDSVLGATLQPRLGRRGNDLVNLFSTAAAGALAVAFA